MATQFSQQYAFRAQKSLGLVNGAPNYDLVPSFESPDVAARMFRYSSDGRLFAYTLPNLVRIFQAEGAQLLQELAIPNIVDIRFSPRGTYLSTWERPVKLEDGSQHKNLRIFSASTGEELISFTQKSQESWDVQYTISESHAIRLVSSEIQVYRPSEWSKGIVDKLKIEGATSVTLSSGLNPSIAVFVAEKKGLPASVKIYGLLSLNGPPTCQKTFFKADRAQIKWNVLGTQVLVLTQTEVDNSGKSYYGETGMYLLSAAGNFDCRVSLDKEGPIHDFAWSPNSKEFGVVYGFMPAKAMLFDQRVRTLHDFGSAPYNTISFNPQGRLVLLAGYGNLAGKTDIFDRRSLNRICTIDAPGTSHLEWAPDGRFLMTATLSPRLRVDNGVKVWHCSGPLIHVQTCEELYQVGWKPTPIDNVPPFPQNIPSAPEPTASVKSFTETQKPVALKAAGAYRPPGARGTATPAIYKREDEGGFSRQPTPGAATPPRQYNRSPQVPGAPSNGYPNGPGGQGGYGNGYGGHHGGRRHVPGAPSTGSPGPDHERNNNNKNQKRKKGKKEGKDQGNNDEKGENAGAAEGQGQANGNAKKANGKVSPPPPPPELTIEIGSPVPPGPESALDPTAKKVRNLNKKLKAIEELKDKQKRGERLEATQLRKIDGEVQIRKELAELGA